MSKRSFRSIFQGKQDKLEANIDLIASPLVAKLEACGVITEYHKSSIEAKPTKQEKAARLLDILTMRDDDLVAKFFEALKAAGQDHIVRLLDAAAESQPPVPVVRPANQAATAAAKYGRKLSNARGDLVQSINVNASFLADMMYDEVLTQEKKSVIQSLYDDKKDSENQPRARAQLIDIVEAAGDVGFETLVRALAKNDQETLAKQLDEELAGRFIKKPPEVAKRLNDSRGDLVAFMHVDELLLSCMMEKSIISRAQKEAIQRVNDEQRAAGMLLDLVSVTLDEDDRTAFDQLVYALVRTEQLYCARMLDEELTEQCLQQQGSKHVMSIQHQKALKSARCDLLNNVIVSGSSLSHHLISNRIITPNMKSEVDREGTEDDKVGKLLDKLERCGPNAFDVFVKALVDTNQQHAADILTNAVKST